MRSSAAYMILALSTAIIAHAQENGTPVAAPPALVAGAGTGFIIKHYPGTSFEYVRTGGLLADTRIAWRISDFFGISIGAGYVQLASASSYVRNRYGSGQSNLRLTSLAVPLSLYMRFRRFSVEPGLVAHIVTSRLDAFDESSRAEKLDLGYVLESRYYIPIGRNVELALGIAVQYITDLQLLLAAPKAGIELALLR